MRLRTLAYAALIAASLQSAGAELELPRTSQKATVSQTVGYTVITVTYGRPAVHGRQIWGDLIAFDQVWRTGANEATTVSFSTDVKVEGQKLAAGTYSLHTIPSKNEWTVIFNRAANQWGSFEYDAAQDALRVRVTPRTAEHQEWLLFSFPRATQSDAELAIQWEKLKVVVHIEADTVNLALAKVRKALADAKSDDWQTRYRAAEYAFHNNVATSDALAWIDQSIAIQPVYQNLALKAQMLAERGDATAAVEMAQKALAAARTSERRVDSREIEALLTQLRSRTNR